LIFFYGIKRTLYLLNGSGPELKEKNTWLTKQGFQSRATLTHYSLKPMHGVKLSLREIERFFTLKYAISSFGKCVNN